MNRPQDRRADPAHPHNQMLLRRFERQAERTFASLRRTVLSTSLATTIKSPEMRRAEYEARQATLPPEDRVPW